MSGQMFKDRETTVDHCWNAVAGNEEAVPTSTDPKAALALEFSGSASRKTCKIINTSCSPLAIMEH